jgi:hypothetical protein
MTGKYNQNARLATGCSHLLGQLYRTGRELTPLLNPSKQDVTSKCPDRHNGEAAEH